MDLSAWEISAEELQGATTLREEITRYCQDNPENLKLYSGAVAIDGETTKDRDDAIKISRSRRQVIVEVFIANPTAFIEKDSVIDIAAQSRKTSLYFTAEKMPMLPSELSEGSLSLNAGKVTPAIRIATKFNAKTGKIESIDYERCLVEADNLTYEDVSKRISRGDKKFAAWSQISSWLKSIRAKNSKMPVLPDYDPDTGVLTTEEGRMRNFSSHAVNAYFIVAESMILANQSAAILMRSSFEGGLGVYRTQSSVKKAALYTAHPRKHASLGVSDYTHATSPNRRYADILVHRFLAQLGTSYTLDLLNNELNLGGFAAPYPLEELRGILFEINHYLQREKQFHSAQRSEDGQKLLAKIFPDTDLEKLKKFEPIKFSVLLKSAAEYGVINDVFANEVLARVFANGGVDGRLALIFPKDAINLFRFAERCQGENANLWKNIRKQVLNRLANDSLLLDQVFDGFIGKIDAGYHIQKASFISKTTGQSNQARAAVVVMSYLGRDYSTAEFAIGFSERPTDTRAKIELLRGFGDQTLLADKQPELPSDKEVYGASKLYRENTTKRIDALRKDGYEIEETIRAFSSNKETGVPRGYKYDAKISKDGNVILSVSVRRGNEEDAQRVGIETAIIALREKDRISENTQSHTSLATFTGNLYNGQGVSYSNVLLVSPKRTQISDYEAWEKLITAIRKKCKVSIDPRGKSIIITNSYSIGKDHNHLDNLVDLITEAFPKSELVIQRGKLRFNNPPPELKMMVREAMQR